MPDLKTASTVALIDELASRAGTEKISVGPYQTYRLEKKYEVDGSKEISADTVILINDYTGPCSEM